MQLRMYRVALAISFTLNVLLIAAIWAYLHFEGLMSVIDTAVGIVN